MRRSRSTRIVGGYSSYAFANSVRRRRTCGQRQLLRAHFWDAFVATNDNTMGTARRLSASHRPTDPRPLHASVTCTLDARPPREIMDCHDATDNRLEDVDISTNRLLHWLSLRVFLSSMLIILVWIEGRNRRINQKFFPPDLIRVWKRNRREICIRQMEQFYWKLGIENFVTSEGKGYVSKG